MNIKKLLLRNETALIIAIIVLSLIIGIKSPEFFTLANLFDIFRSSFVQLIFALGVLIVIISGGIDISFPAVGIFAGYTAVVLMQRFEWNPENLLLPIALAIIIGTILGAINSIAIATFGIPTLIATLGTSGIFRGLMLTFIGSSFISDPYGRILARAGRNGSAVLVADLDLDQKRDWLTLFPFFSTRRPSMYKNINK